MKNPNAFGINVLISDPDSDSRGRLKQAAMAVTNFNKIYSASSLKDTIFKVHTDEVIDVVVLSYRYGDEILKEFLKDAQETDRGLDWAYMKVMGPKEQKGESVAAGVLGGFHGFLCEPFSADTLKQMAEITASVRKENQLRRKKAAIKILVDEIAEHIDALSLMFGTELNQAGARRKLGESAKKLTQFKDPESFAMYVDTLCEAFDERNPPLGAAYSGASERVKERLEAKMMRELAEKYS